MKVVFSSAIEADAPALAALHTAVSEDLTRRYGHGFWSSKTTERGVLHSIRSSRVVVAYADKAVVGTLRLQPKKPWAIDTSYFTPAKTAIYLVGMAVIPDMQRKGIGGKLLREAVKQVQAWPADVIRLDAFDAAAGAGGFYAKCGFREVAHVVYKNDPLIYFELLVHRLREK
jgi:predicted N-acetyltransferase YhbS